MKDVVSEMELTESLRQFKCTKDHEIQTFLQEKAIQYEDMHFILIGQLGKFIDEENLKSTSEELSGEELLNQAFEIIFQVKERIVCNCVLIECKDDIKIRKIYENYGFQELQKEDDLVQYIKFI